MFISSPSDLGEERRAVIEAITQVNDLRGKREGFRLEPLRYEKDVRPDFGKEPQAIINEQIGDDYDIFVGILCGRFGSRTEQYSSGTEEEFQIARERRERTGSEPKIMLYFKDPRHSSDRLDAEQLLLVHNFKKLVEKISKYDEFTDLEAFRTSLTKHLASCVDEIRTVGSLQGSRPVSPLVSSDLTAEAENDILNSIIPSELDTFGILELNIHLQEGFSDLIELTSDFTKSQSNLGEKFKSHIAEIAEEKRKALGGQVNQNTAKKIVDKTAQALEDFSLDSERMIPRMEGVFMVISETLRRLILISSEDGFGGISDALDLKRILSELRETIRSSGESVAGLRISISSLPRLTSQLNSSKRRAAKSLEAFDTFMATCDNQLEMVQTHLDGLINGA